MFRGLQAASARFNLRSTMDLLNLKIGAGSGDVLEATMVSKDIIKGLLIDLTFLVDTLTLGLIFIYGFINSRNFIFLF